MQRTALYGLYSELPTKLGLRSFHGMRGAIELQTIDREPTESLRKEKYLSLVFFIMPLECTMGNPNKALYLQIEVYAHICR